MDGGLWVHYLPNTAQMQCGREQSRQNHGEIDYVKT